MTLFTSWCLFLRKFCLGSKLSIFPFVPYNFLKSSPFLVNYFLKLKVRSSWYFISLAWYFSSPYWFQVQHSCICRLPIWKTWIFQIYNTYTWRSHVQTGFMYVYTLKPVIYIEKKTHWFLKIGYIFNFRNFSVLTSPRKFVDATPKSNHRALF